MKTFITWSVIALLLASFWGLAAFVLSRDIDTTIIVFGVAFFGSFLVSGFMVSAARRMTDGR